jgi:transposase
VLGSGVRRTCPDCGGALRRPGQDADEMLDVLPVHWRLVRNVRLKYSCRTREKIVQTAAPVKTVARGKATFATLAHVVVSKFEHHLPLYRQSEMTAAQGLDIYRSTLTDWDGQAAALLDPVVSRIREEVLKGDKIHADDTPVPVLDPGRGRTATGAAMGLCGRRPRLRQDDPGSDIVSLHDRPHRCTSASPSRRISRLPPSRRLCWLRRALSKRRHRSRVLGPFRRKGFDLHERVTTPLTTDILERIGALYGIEAEVGGRPPDVRLAARQNRTKPLVDALREALDAALRRLSPKSDMGKAIAYGTKRWPALCRFLDDGRLEIDNNIAERALRGVAVGRRNWLFAGSKTGGERAAAIYTVIQTCKANGVDPQACVADVTGKIAADWQAARCELMP